MAACGAELVQQISKFLEVPVKNVSCNEKDKVIVAKLNNGKSIKGFGTLVTQLARSSKKNMLGKNFEEEAEVKQWVEYSVCYVNYVDCPLTKQRVLKELNSYLADRTYFVGCSETLADVVLYCALYKTMSSLSFQEKEQYMHLSRWFNYVQQQGELRQKNAVIYFCRMPLYE